MRTLRVNDDAMFYNAAADDMFFKIGNASLTVEEEVGPGIHVLFSYDGTRRGGVYGVDIEYFNERFAGADEIVIPLDPPFAISLAKVPVSA